MTSKPAPDAAPVPTVGMVATPSAVPTPSVTPTVDRGPADLIKDMNSGLLMIQSPYLYVQAAGSDRSDGSASGIHLRWDLLRSLSEHLPKGNLASDPGTPYPATYGFNKPDDFVGLLRVPYKPYPCTVNFSTSRPAALVETGTQRVWKFDTVLQPTGAHREVVMRFVDVAQYDAIRAAVNPLTAPADLLARYTGVVEAEVTNQLCFALSLTAAADPKAAEPAVRVEAVSVSENFAGADLVISCRRRFIVAAKATPSPEARVVAENVRYFRFDYTKCSPAELRLETYEQFIFGNLAQKTGGWATVGTGFSLTVQDAVAYARLEDPALANVHRKWPRYVGADQASGAFTTSVPNYKSKWDPTLPPASEHTDDNGLRKGVISYLSLSMNPANAAALASLPAQDPTDGGAFDISYLRMLKLVALDFHVARMLGLGYIDASISPATAGTFVYLAVYRTTAALEPGGSAAPHTHLYMTLPTARLDFRLPPAPVQDAPTFGLAFDTGTGSPTQLTDVNGYTPFDDARMINLHVEPYDVVQAFGKFFVPPTEFCSSEVTKPVFYGFKYKLTSEANYRAPELSDDTEFPDPSGKPEVVPLLPQISAVANTPDPPIYTHAETENGTHSYAFYGVNWFSRPSPLGTPANVTTLLPVRNMLLPPANFAVQLIQPEDPLILTTAKEQQMFAAITAGDTTLVRCTFEWNQNHYLPQRFSATNVYADKAQIFFRQQPPRAVQGEIASVTSLSDTLVEVHTRSYTLTSVSPPQTVTPAVVPGDEPRFVGSSFAADQVLYVVDSVAQPTVSGEGAVFRLKKQVQTGVVDLGNDNQFSTTVNVTIPAPGDRFLVVENMSEPSNWGANVPLAKEVAIVNFLTGGQLHTETVTNSDGSQTTSNIGGIQQQATIVELQDVYSPGNSASAAAGSPIPGSKTGIFEISFASYQLANHPDPDVEWYKGTMRVPEAASGKLKPLEVWKIDVSGSALKLTAFDPTFNVDVAYAPLAGYNPIQTVGSVSVNFHPGYRVYLRAQSGVFDQPAIMPGPAQDAKQTFLAVRSRNTQLAANSHPSTPVVMQARRITVPLAPGLPNGPLYATRPDFYGKATWTMDVKVTVDSTRKPYALVVYRANERAVLDTLYDSATAESVRTALAALPAADAAFAANRWNDLVNVQNLHADKNFNQYVTGGYRFPIPNNTLYVIPGTSVAPFDGVKRPGDSSVTFTIGGQPFTMPDVVKAAVEGVFLPLTESPLMYQFIKTGTQTSSKRPVTRDANGDLLPFTSAAWDPSPMAVKHVDTGGNTLVRFTDYTLDGAAKNFYFYYAVEMSDQLKLSPRSAIAGPVHLVNAYPAEAPVVRTVTSMIEDQALQIPTGVKLVVNAYLVTEGITKFNLYRATSAGDAATIRTMKLAGTYDAAAGAETTITDTFGDLAFPPFGDPIFYCVVALRRITNEHNATELIPSHPSALARASVIDVNNPVAPDLIFSADPPVMSTPVQLTNVILTWAKAGHNATYRLYKQDVSGNWVRIYTTTTDADPVNVPLSSTDLATGVLLKQNPQGRPVYHRFKLDVENTSGLFSLNENVLSVPATCNEALAFFTAVVSYADLQFTGPLSDRIFHPQVSAFPGTMTFTNVVSSLPAGHVFDRIEVRVADGLGHSARKTITAAGGSVVFQHGDGTGIVLNGSTANVVYGIRVTLFTDSCQDGLIFPYRLQFGPDVALMGITSLLSYADSATTTSPLVDPFVASGVHIPTKMTFTDVSVLPAGHTFAALNIQLQDDGGGSFSKNIAAAHGSVTFNHGDGGLGLDASAPGRTYLVSARLVTNLSPGGVLFRYNISYQ